MTYKTANEIADRVLEKLAAITDEDVARGLAGARNREDITPEEVQQYGQDAYDRSYDEGSFLPWGFGALGAGVGGIAGGSVAGAPGAAIGAGVGGLSVGGLAQLARLAEAHNEKRYHQGLANVAREGRIPYNAHAGDLWRYRQHARGMQEDMVDSEAIERHKEEQRRYVKSQALKGALRGAVTGNLLHHGMTEDGGSVRGEIGSTLTGGALGGLADWEEAERDGGEQLDLRERGYGHLADVMRRRGVM